MASVALVKLQPVWDCRWSRPGHRLTGVPDALQPEDIWVCVREGSRRNILDIECRTCPHWQPETGISGISAAADVATLVRNASHIGAERLLGALARALLILTAVLFVTIGFVTLTGPLSVPFTVAFWLCAAAFAGLAVFWQFPNG